MQKKLFIINALLGFSLIYAGDQVNNTTDLSAECIQDFIQHATYPLKGRYQKLYLNLKNRISSNYLKHATDASDKPMRNAIITTSVSILADITSQEDLNYFKKWVEADSAFIKKYGSVEQAHKAAGRMSPIQNFSEERKSPSNHSGSSRYSFSK